MPPTPLIDCHTHAYPPELATNPRAWAETRGEAHWADLVAPRDRKSIQGWSDPGSMLTAMDAAGVSQAVLLGWYWTREATCRWHNAVIAEWVQAAPDRFIGFASISPHTNVIDQLESAQKLGLCGVGEMHIGVQAFNAATPGWHSLAAWCAAERWPVNLHVTEVVGHDHPGRVATPLMEFVHMAAAQPDLNMILAHWGGGLAYFEQNPRIRKTLRNVAYDTAASPLLYDMSMFKHMLGLVGPKKLLFGSDYPLRLYPRTQNLPDMQRYVTAVREKAGLDTSTLASLFGGNFLRLIGAGEKENKKASAEGD